MKFGNLNGKFKFTEFKCELLKMFKPTFSRNQLYWIKENIQTNNESSQSGRGK